MSANPLRLLLNCIIIMGVEFGRMKAIIRNWFICRRILKLRVTPFHTNINQTWCCFTATARRRVISNWMAKYKNIYAKFEHLEWSVIGRRKWELPNIFPPFYLRLPTLQGVEMSIPCLVVQLLGIIPSANVVQRSVPCLVVQLLGTIQPGNVV
jgi:hypothetical protein